MLKFTNADKTAALFNNVSFSLATPENWQSIGDSPTREAVLAYLAEGNTPQLMDTPSLATLKQALILKIDADIDAIYTVVVGNRFAEYQDAAAEAKAFKDAGYTGTAGASVAGWATVKGQTNTWAANDILATATAWKSAQAQMRGARLTHKENAKAATSATQYNAVNTSWNATLNALKAALGVA
jgi:hypothetical protein